MKVSTMSDVEAFHAHLDVCKQCEQHPFDLCCVGAALLIATAELANGLEEG